MGKREGTAEEREMTQDSLWGIIFFPGKIKVKWARFFVNTEASSTEIPVTYWVQVGFLQR